MIQVENLVKTYGENTALAGLNLTIGRGEIAGLLGPNGAGKSTLMKILTGYTCPDSGSLKLFGFEMSETTRELKKRIGYLPETPPLYFDMTVAEQLRFQCDLKGVDKTKTTGEIERVCGLLQINDVQKRLIKNLSKGYKQRVGFAGALVGCPELLILDEPSSGLDPRQIMDMRNLITELGKSATIIISSHILSEIASVCGRLIIMKKGRILANDTPQNLEKQYAQKERVLITVYGVKEKARLLLSSIPGVIHYTESLSADLNSTDFTLEAESGFNLREKLFALFENSGMQLTRLQPLTMTLEDIFIDLTGKGHI